MVILAFNFFWPKRCHQFRWHDSTLSANVEKAAATIGYSFSGVHAPKDGKGIYSLQYGAFVVPLVKAVQEQQALTEKQQIIIDQLIIRIETLEKK